MMHQITKQLLITHYTDKHMLKILRIANNEKKLSKENVFTHFKILMIN